MLKLIWLALFLPYSLRLGQMAHALSSAFWATSDVHSENKGSFSILHIGSGEWWDLSLVNQSHSQKYYLNAWYLKLAWDLKLHFKFRIQFFWNFTIFTYFSFLLSIFSVLIRITMFLTSEIFGINLPSSVLPLKSILRHQNSNGSQGRTMIIYIFSQL